MVEMNPAVRQSLPILTLVVVGFLLKQVGLIRPGDSQVIARLIISITLQAVIFLSIAQANATPAMMALLGLCGVVVSLGLGVTSTALTSYLHLERQIAGVIILGAFIQLRYTNLPLMGLAVALRMGGGFLLGQACVLLAHLQGLDRVAVSMGSAMPVGMAVMDYSASEGMDAELAAGTISLSILVGLTIMPVLLSLY